MVRRATGSHLRLSKAFLAALSRERGDAVGSAELEAELRGAVATGKNAFASAELSEVEFVRFLASKLQGNDFRKELAELHLEDLYLVCACLHGHSEAFAALEAKHFARLAREAIRLRAEFAQDEAKQVLRELLFVARPDQQPAIAQYSGKSALGGWLRVIAIREILRLKKMAERARPEDELPNLASTGGNPELQHLRTRYQGEFRAAFSEALTRLTEKDRVILRQHFLDGLGIDGLAKVHKVHRATTARWLTKAKEDLAELTKQILRQRLSLKGSELDSLVRLVRSELEVSLAGLIRNPS